MPRGNHKNRKVCTTEGIVAVEAVEESWLAETSGWRNRSKHRNEWTAKTGAFIGRMVCCAICGIVVFGVEPGRKTGDAIGLPQNWKAVEMKEPPDYPFAAPHLINHMKPDGPTIMETWYQCRTCVGNKGFLSSAVSTLDVEYQAALADVPPILLQALSCVDSAFQIREKYASFAKGEALADSYLDSPMISNAMTAVSGDHIDSMRAILADSILNNPVMSRFQTIWEATDFLADFPVLVTDVIETFMQNSRERGPLNEVQLEAAQHDTISLLTDVAHIPAMTNAYAKLFKVGRAIPRSASGELMNLQCDAMGMLQNTRLTLEALMFPYLFPDVRNVYCTAHSIHDYIKMRAQQMFSFMTYIPQYVLALFQMKQALSFDQKVQVCLEHEYAKLKKKNPKATEEDLFKILLKQHLPKELHGSPAYFKKELNNLLAMVKKYGMPTLFVTLTADEVSSTRWNECADMEAVMAAFLHRSVPFSALPVENAALFVHRLNKFFDTYILGGSQILGRIQHHIIRFELQGRGSLHAHCLLWVHPDDKNLVSRSIVAAIPGVWNISHQMYDVPTDPEQKCLFEQVMQKQQHKCRQGGCRSGHKPYCKYGFPFAPHAELQPTLSATSRMYQYFRPREADQWTSPYHPLLLLLWGAHINVQVVTQADWSRYVCKYALKAEPAGTLNLDVTSARKLGVVMSDAKLRAFSAFLLSRPVSITEAAMFNLNIPMVHTSNPVTHINTQPTQSRKRIVTGSRSGHVVHPIQKYENRPACLEEVTFYQYYNDYTFRPKKLQRTQLEYVGPDMAEPCQHVYKSASLVTFTDFHPQYHKQGFFFNVLLANTIFRNEGDLLSDTNQQQCYFLECVLQQLIRSVEDIDRLVEGYYTDHLNRTSDASHATAPLHEAFQSILSDPGNYIAVACTADFESQIAELHAGMGIKLHPEFQSFSGAVLTDEQMTAMAGITASSCGLHVLSGTPGSGKTFTTKVLVHRFLTQGKKVLLTGTTGAAASRLGSCANTVHSAFRIPKTGQYTYPLQCFDLPFQSLLAADLIVIDEISMLTVNIFSTLMKRIKDVCGDDFLARKLVLLCGDHAQLPAICTHRAPPLEASPNICASCHISTSRYWTEMQWHNLQHSVRQAEDPAYLAFLNAIRDGQPSQEVIDSALSSCYVQDPTQYCLDNTDCVVICTHNEDVDKFNTTCLQARFPADGLVNCGVHIDGPQDMLGNAEVIAFKDHLKNDRLSCIAIGAPIVLKANINIAKGAVNNATAIVKDVSMKDGRINKLIITVTDSKQDVTLTRSLVERMYYMQSVISFRAFPCILGYAMTAHASQGATISGKVLLMVREAFAPGLLYVMLSRVTKRANLKIGTPLSPEHFHPVRTPSP